MESENHYRVSVRIINFNVNKALYILSFLYDCEFTISCNTTPAIYGYKEDYFSLCANESNIADSISKEILKANNGQCDIEIDIYTKTEKKYSFKDKE
ncbi:MAG: hypothetical protein AABY32_01560 [Nanoarchaeota archaeon]